MKNNKKFMGLLSTALTLSLFVTGCGASQSSDSSSTSSESDTLSAETMDSETSGSTEILSDESAVAVSATDLFSDRDLDPSYDSVMATITINGDSVNIDGSGASFDGSAITITDEGVYVISGTLDDGQIIVNSEGKIQLVLDNANISCSTSAPIYIANAKKTFITLAEGSENTLTDNDSYVYENEEDNEPDAVIFSTDSLTINGSGTLSINALYNEGITSKDDVVITNGTIGTINVDSVGNGIKGKDYVAICGGTLNITAGGDGVKSSNTEDTSLGYVYVEGGTLNIDTQEDGIQAETDFIAVGGTFNITAGGGSSNAGTHSESDFGEMGGGGRGGFSQGYSYDYSDSSDDTTVSTKGIKGGTTIDISGGTFTIDSADDTLHSNNEVTIAGGTLTLCAGDDGIHADSQINISDGTVTITESYEGIEAAIININGGTIEVTASDDGFNASDGSTQGGIGTSASDVALNISGGVVYVDAAGDGLDSNSDMTISGGTIIVNGPEDSSNGALDGENEIVVTGGLLLAAGSSGMAESPGNSSTQNCISAGFNQTYSSDTLITLCTEDGTEIVSFAPAKTFSHIVISSPDIESCETYTLYVGGTSSEEEKYGLYVVGGYNDDGTEYTSLTTDSTVTYAGSGNMMSGGIGGGDMGARDNMGGGGRGGFTSSTDGFDSSNIPDDVPDDMPSGDFGGGDMPSDGFNNSDSSDNSETIL